MVFFFELPDVPSFLLTEFRTHGRCISSKDPFDHCPTEIVNNNNLTHFAT